MGDSSLPPNSFFTKEKWDNIWDVFEKQLTENFDLYRANANHPKKLALPDSACNTPNSLAFYLKKSQNELIEKVPPVPKSPSMKWLEDESVPTLQKLKLIQNYMEKLGYNHILNLTFPIRKANTMRRLMTIARDMIQQGLPIKCLEATILGIYFTNPIKIVKDGNSYGALGLSRRSDLMYKPCTFTSLAMLIKDYKESYENHHHELLKIKLGFLAPHDEFSSEQINFKHLSIRLGEQSWSATVTALDCFVREMGNEVNRVQDN